MLSTAYHMVAIDNHLNSPAANTTSSTAFDVKQQHLRYVVAAVCFLSMIGAILIVLSYVCIKQIRTRARQILVHLSLADFGVACSNFIGTTVYFDQYIRGCNDSTSHVIPCATLHHLCKTQAFFAGYSTLVSVLWTLFLALYIYCLIVYSQRRLHVIVVYCGYIICWGMPLLVIAWLLVEDRLGYAPHGGSGWCSLKFNKDDGGKSIFVVIFANDLWVYLTFIMVTILYLNSHCYLQFQAKESNPILSSASHQSSVVSTADKKFLLIPFAFLFLRIWSEILVFYYVYLGHELRYPLADILLYLAGIGDSAQGLVNAILFCVFTPKVRDGLFCCRCCRKRGPLNLQEGPSASSLDSYYGSLEGSCIKGTKK